MDAVGLSWRHCGNDVMKAGFFGLETVFDGQVRIDTASVSGYSGFGQMLS